MNIFAESFDTKKKKKNWLKKMLALFYTATIPTAPPFH